MTPGFSKINGSSYQRTFGGYVSSDPTLLASEYGLDSPSRFTCHIWLAARHLRTKDGHCTGYTVQQPSHVLSSVPLRAVLNTCYSTDKGFCNNSSVLCEQQVTKITAAAGEASPSSPGPAPPPAARPCPSSPSRASWPCLCTLRSHLEQHPATSAASHWRPPARITRQTGPRRR